jgi:protein-disulfide isomerase
LDLFHLNLFSGTMTVNTQIKTTKPTTSRPAVPDQRTLLMLGGVIAVAVVIALVAIVISSGAGLGSDIHKYDEVPQSRTADGAFVLGDPDAPFTLVEFADFACLACQQYRPTLDEFLERYVRTGQAKFESRIIMTAGGATTGFASQLAECAEAQRPGAYWQAHVLLYDYGSRGAGTYNESMARPFAEALNLDLANLFTCVREDADQITVDSQFAQQNGATSTPTVLFRLNDGQAQPLPGGRDIDSLATLVEAAQAMN